MEVAGLWHSRLINPNPKPKLQLRVAILLLLLLVLVGSSEAVASGRFDGATSGKKGVRSRIQIAARVLHEPFFPVPPSPAPSPGTGFESPPEPVNGHRTPFTNQPFFPLSPSFSPPAPPSETSIPTNVGAPHVGNKSNRSKKIVIATLVSLSAIVALCALLFVLHKQRDRDRWGSDKFVDETPLTSAGTPANPRVFQEPGPVTKVATNGGSDVLYLGTLEPFGNRTSIGDGDTHMDNAHTHSQNMDEIRNPNPNPNPNTKFSMPNGEEIEDRFLRQSPEIEPLPPLAKRPRPNNSTDSSDEESFYSPRCLSTSSSRSHSGSPLSSSVCKRLFSPPSQRPPTVKSPQSTRSYPSSATSSTPSSPSPLDSPPSSLYNSPSPPITPTVLPPPIRAHSHSPLHQFSRHVLPSSKPVENSKTPPPTGPPHPTHHIYANSSNSSIHIFEYRRMKQFHNQEQLEYEQILVLNLNEVIMEDIALLLLCSKDKVGGHQIKKSLYLYVGLEVERATIFYKKGRLYLKFQRKCLGQQTLIEMGTLLVHLVYSFSIRCLHFILQWFLLPRQETVQYF